MLPQRLRPTLNERPFGRLVRVWNVFPQRQRPRMVHRAARRGPVRTEGGDTGRRYRRGGSTVAAAAIITVTFKRSIRHVPIRVDRRVAQRAQLIVQRDRDRFEGHRTWNGDSIIGKCTVVGVLFGRSV